MKRATLRRHLRVVHDVDTRDLSDEQCEAVHFLDHDPTEIVSYKHPHRSFGIDDWSPA